MNQWLVETRLEGKHVSLLPMQIEHRDHLVAAASDGELWELWYTVVPSVETIDAYIDKALTDKRAGRSSPFYRAAERHATHYRFNAFSECRPGQSQAGNR